MRNIEEKMQLYFRRNNNVYRGGLYHPTVHPQNMHVPDFFENYPKYGGLLLEGILIESDGVKKNSSTIFSISMNMKAGVRQRGGSEALKPLKKIMSD